MADYFSLKRFIDAQQSDYAIALKEIKHARKRSHWMWYIFPQIHGLGFSETTQYYAIKDRTEASAYLQHPALGKRLIEISTALLDLDTNDATQVFGSPDDVKLKSSMTLFATLASTEPVFEQVLEKFFQGSRDQQTLRILGNK